MRHASVHVVYSRLPSVWLADRALVAEPMGFLVAAASQLAGIQSCLLIQSPVPKLQHFMLTFCQCGMAFLLAPSDSCTIWTSSAKTSAAADDCLPLTTTSTLPPSSFMAAGCEVVRAALVCLTPLRNQMRCLCVQGIVVADLLVCTEGTSSALPPFPARPAVWCCQPTVWMTIWTLTAGPPDLGVGVGSDDNIPKVIIPGMVPLALQKWAEEANVWACLLNGGKSCGGALWQAALYLKMYSTA